MQLDSLRHLRSADNLADLYRQLGYPAEQDVSANTPDEIGMEGAAASDAVRVYLLVDLDDSAGSLQHVHFETRDLNSATLRRITERWMSRPGEYLLTFTEAARPFERLIFVKPRRDAGGVKMSRLTVQPSRPTAHDRSVLNEIELKAGMGVLAAHKKQADAFNIERVTKAFYREYHTLFVHVRDTIEAENPNVQIGPLAKNTTADKASLHAFTQRLLGRIIFLYFIQKKGWLNHNADFITDLYKQATRHDGSNFYRDALEELFFNVLNTPRPGNDSALGEVPYLNGSLFEREYPATTTMNLPNSLFDPALDGSILHTLGSYNFTVNESGALEQDVSLDPEMLGKVFENMMEKGEAADSGTFYTPRSIVQFMVEETLTRYLEDTTAIPQTRLLPLCADDSEAHDLTLKEARDIMTALQRVRVLDPAVGTASMLVGFLNAMIRVRRSAESREAQTPFPDSSPKIAQWKREYIQHCLYGVDIKHEAIEIARLRLWLSLVVDAQEAEPLPNLDYKLMAGDGLLETVDGKSFNSVSQRQGLFDTENEMIKAIQAINHKKDQFYDPGVSNVVKLAIREDIHVLERTVFSIQIDGEIDILNREIAGLNAEILAKNTDSVQETRAQKADAQKSKSYVDRLAQQLTEKRTRMNMLIDRKMKVTVEKEPLPFFLHHVHFAEVMKGTAERPLQGFDIVIGNPPYVRHERLDKPYKAALGQAFSEVATGTADLYVYFYQKGLNLLREGGRLAYITPNKFMRAGYGERLRGVLSSKTRLELLADFGDLPVFDAITYPLIAMMQHAQPDGNVVQMLPERTLKLRLSTELERGIEGVREGLSSFHTYARDLMAPLNPTELGLQEWTLEDPDVLRLMKKFRKQGTPLGELVGGRFYRGIQTGANDVFVIPNKNIVEVEDFIKIHDVVKPMVSGSEMKRWNTKAVGKYVILSSWDIALNQYPKIEKYLNENRTRLESRPEVKQGKFPWYSLTRFGANHRDSFEGPKILYPHFAKNPSFSFDTVGLYPSDKGYFIPNPPPYLLSILNSRLYWFYIISISPSVRGGFHEQRVIYLRFFPVVIPSSEQACILESFTDDSRLSDLNALVYEMYGLTPAEIELVERLTAGAYAAGEADVGELEDEDAEAVEA